MSTPETRDRLPARLMTLLAEPIGDLGLDLEAVEVSSAGKRRVLRVAVDQDGGVSMDDIADATRAVSGVLDTSDVMGQQAYTLEVSSRGVDRPLTAARHWRRNTDRLVTVVFADPEEHGEPVTGRVTEAGEDAAVLDVAGTPRSIAYDQVAKAKVQIEFTRKQAD